MSMSMSMSMYMYMLYVYVYVYIYMYISMYVCMYVYVYVYVYVYTHTYTHTHTHAKNSPSPPGLGSKILKRLIELSSMEGAACIKADVFCENKRALRFLEARRWGTLRTFPTAELFDHGGVLK